MESLLINAEYAMSIIYMEYQWFFPALMIGLGATLGSFLTCALYRVPRKLSLIKPRSYCPRCKNSLKVIDLIPVLSYVIFLGKCRQCGSKIPPKYLLIELTSIAIGLISYNIWILQFKMFVGFAMLISWQFAVLLFIREKQIAVKVLLFSIIMLLYLYSY